MPVDASGTRERIMDEAQRLFAVHGVEGAQISEIVRAAGQANDSAVHYHFGSRFGLLAAVCERQIAAMEPARTKALDAVNAEGLADDLPALIGALVQPTGALLKTQDGRWFLLIMAQLSGRAGIRSKSMPREINSTVLLEQLVLIQAALRRTVPDRLARERLAIVVNLLTTALAERATQIDRGSRMLLGHKAFLANLEAMIVAALTAPW
jgi:TetR/AcrR family transcriptional regulator, regulator of cefoperazone and chloramphenicol sensitivity